MTFPINPAAVAAHRGPTLAREGGEDLKHAPAEPPAGWHVSLKTVGAEGKAHGGFQWPIEGPWPKKVACPDWNDRPECGGGLHLLERGEGDGSLLDWSPDAVWLAVAHDPALVVDLGEKIKVPSCEVIFAGKREEVIALVAERNPGGAVVGISRTVGDAGTATAGFKGTATAGDEGTATAGRYGTATAGFKGTATAGRYGTATAGDEGTATAGDAGTATAGDEGTATAGDEGTATAGRYGTATAGFKGTATAGFKGTATAGRYGTATAGFKGTATAGDEGILTLRWWDSEANRYRLAVAYVGEDGIKPNTAYTLDAAGKFVEARS